MNSPTRRPEDRCTRHSRFETRFTRAVFALVSGVFLFNLIRFLGDQP